MAEEKSVHYKLGVLIGTLRNIESELKLCDRMIAVNRVKALINRPMVREIIDDV